MRALMNRLWNEVRNLWPSQTRSKLALAVVCLVALAAVLMNAALQAVVQNAMDRGDRAAVDTTTAGPTMPQVSTSVPPRAATVKSFRLAPRTVMYSPPDAGLSSSYLSEFAGVYNSDALFDVLTGEHCLFPDERYDAWWLARRALRIRDDVRVEAIDETLNALRSGALPTGRRAQIVQRLLQWLHQQGVIANADLAARAPTREEVELAEKIIEHARAMLSSRPQEFFRTPLEQAGNAEPTNAEEVSPFNVIFDIVLENPNESDALLIEQVRFVTDAVGITSGGAGDAEYEPAYPLYVVADVPFEVGHSASFSLDAPIVIPPGQVARFSVEAFPGGTYSSMENEIVTHWIGRFAFIDASHSEVMTERVCVYYPLDIGAISP